MTLNVEYCDVEKSYLKWLRVLSYVERTWSSPIYAIYVLFD